MGVLAGDDYTITPIEKMTGGCIFGVTKAVNEFCEQNKKMYQFNFMEIGFINYVIHHFIYLPEIGILLNKYYIKDL